MTFDGWDAQLCADGLSYGQDSLMHFRTKGSKNGVRRYQEADGTWTPLGLKERRAREGWGERRAARKEARAQQRAERKAARAAARSANIERARQYKQQRDELKRKRNPRNLSDAELQKGIERLKMEQEYRELNKSPLLKVGEELVSKYMNYRVSRIEAENKRQERNYQYIKLRTEAENARARAKADIKKAEADMARAKADALEVKKGKKAAANEAKLVGAKLAYRNTTIHGGIGKLFNKKLSAIGDYAADMAKSRAKVDNIIESDRKQTAYNQQKADAAAKRAQKAADAAAREQQKRNRAEARQRRKNNRQYGYSGSYGHGPNLN